MIMMNKSKVSQLFGGFVLVGLVVASVLPAQTRPDIVYVLLDDLGFSDIPAYGGEVETPTLDRLAAEGVRFTDFYNASKCEPTRASLMSGLYWPVTQLNLQRGMTIGQVLQGADYATFAIGKWHLAGNPVNRGFDRYFGHLSGASPFFPPVNESFRLNDRPYRPNDPNWYATDAMTDYAIQFIEESHNANPDKPFFLYLAYNAPHNPLQAPREDIMRYRGRYLEGWDVLRQRRYRRQLEIGLFDNNSAPLSNRPINVPAWDSLTPAQQDLEDLRMAVYAAMVDRVDQNLGRLLRRLEELGRADNLLVLFMSDNGASPYWRTDEIMLSRDRLPGDSHSNWEIGLGWANASNTPFRLYKRNQHEGGILTPMIAWYSGGVANPGGWIREPSHIIDLMPTFMEVSGAGYPQTFNGQPNPPLPGKSLMPLLRGEQRKSHEALYFLLYDHAAILQGDWKLVRVDGLPWELFNLAKDRTETNDLARQMPEKAATMEQAFNKWLRTVNMTQYDNPTPPADLRNDRGSGVQYTPSAMPAHLQYRYPLPPSASVRQTIPESPN
jgi:arylsulfatase A-like enzyme